MAPRTANGSAADPRDLLHIVLALLDSAVQGARTASPSGENAEPQKCAQIWCPLCAVAAGVAGEPHPLITAFGEHGTALLALLRSMTTSGGPDGPPDPGPAAPSDGPGRYQHIPVTVHD